MLSRRPRKSVLLLMIGVRRELLRATASGPQAHRGRNNCGPSKKLQTRISPNHLSHLRILGDPRPDATIALSIQTNAAGERMDIQINPWSLLAPRPDICRRDICRPAPGRPAEAVAGQQQPLFPRRPEKRYQESRISTSKSPHLNSE